VAEETPDPRKIDLAVYGIVNSGKSSLINALSRRDARPTGPIGGTTREVSAESWRAVEAAIGP
jgi:ribosome biogenesis GTPase A